MDSDKRHFGGSIAHLALFDQPLAEKQVARLFETFYATKAQSDEDSIKEGVHPTKSGKPCLFPALYRQETVNWLLRIYMSLPECSFNCLILF